MLLTVGQGEGLHVELVAGSQTRFGEELVHGHHQVSLGHTAHPVQDLLNRQRRQLKVINSGKANVAKTTTEIKKESMTQGFKVMVNA